MLLVPKQLRRAGMTGDVPYYGGRFSPAQAYAAAHPSHRAPTPPSISPPSPSPPSPSPPSPSPPSPSPPSPSPRQSVPARDEADTLAALQHLLDTDVIDEAEYRQLRARLPR